MDIQLNNEASSNNPDNAPVLASRGDYMSESLVGKSVDEALEGTEKNQKEQIESLLRSGHFGPFEHATAVFHVEGLSRVAMAQVTRHRHMSFDVQSQRYVNFSDVEPVVPTSMDKQTLEPEGVWGDTTVGDDLRKHFKRSIKKYNRAIDHGVPKEDARFFLPQSTPVNLTFSGNSRTLMHFFDLRNNAKAQWEAQEFAERVLEECKEWSPLTFNAYEEHINNNSLRAP